MIRNIYLGLLLLISAFALGQSGINTLEVNEHAALQVDAPNKDKGVIIPRLTTQQRNSINTTNAEDGLTIYNTDENCINYWNKEEKTWSSSCGNVGKAKFKIENCSDIKVYGQYLSKTQINGNSNYLLITVLVEKAGVYNITATSKVNNGYYFSVSGEYLGVGRSTIKVPGMGVPTNAKFDDFTIQLNGVDSSLVCPIKIEVENSEVKPSFTMECNSTEVFGIYKLDEALGNQHHIKLELNIDPSANGATYFIETEEVDGIKFYGTGKLNTSQPIVTLQGKGIPRTSDIKKMRIKSNSSETVAVCYANVRVTIPEKKLLVVGATDASDSYGFANTSTPVYKMLKEKKNYGLSPESVFSFEGWSDIKSVSANAPLTQYVTGENPYDIVIVQSTTQFNTAQVESLVEYLKNKGVVIIFDSDDKTATLLIKEITASSTVSANKINIESSVYKFSTIDDGVLSGGFGDIRGKYWGASGPVVRVLNLESSDFLIYSDATDQSVPVAALPDPGNTEEGDYDQPSNGNSTGTESQGTPGLTAFNQEGYHFVWVGEGLFNNHNTVFALDGNNKPIEKVNFGHNIKRSVSNSIFTANLIAWAIEQAEKDGINTKNAPSK